MLRLAASHPPLWRSESCLQLGGDGAVRLPHVALWQERLIDALIGGVADAMLVPLARSFGAAPGEAELFVAQIAGALSTVPTGRMRAQAELPSDIGVAEAEAFEHGWRAAGLDIVTMTRWRQDDPDPALALIVVADGLVDPRRAALLVAGGIVHLPVQLAGDRITVGPLVRGGRTACLSCLHAHRTDADPLWPRVAAQLIARRRVPTDAGLALEAAVLAARLLRGPDPAAMAAADGATVSVTLSAADARRSWHVHRRHERCLCRSPLETASAPSAGSPSAATTTATAYARRA